MNPIDEVPDPNPFDHYYRHGLSGAGASSFRTLGLPVGGQYYDHFALLMQKANEERARQEYERALEPKEKRDVKDTDDEPWIDPPKGSRSKLRKGAKGKPYSAEGYKPSKPGPEVVVVERIVTHVKNVWRISWGSDPRPAATHLRLFVNDVLVQKTAVGNGSCARTFAWWVVIVYLVTSIFTYSAGLDGIEAFLMRSAIVLPIVLYAFWRTFSFTYRKRRARRKMVQRYLKYRFHTQFKGRGKTEEFCW